MEHDASEIWDVTRAVAKEALDAAGIDGRSLAGIGITNQRETVVAWDREAASRFTRDRLAGPPHGARCDELKEAGHEPLFRERTGLVLDPYFSGTKIEWLIREGGVPPDAAFGTIDSWLVFKLTGEHATDLSNASRTLLFDIRERRWDPELCELLGVDERSLPEPCPSAHVYGETSEFGGSVPVAGIAGDQQAALYGQACHEPGLGKNTYGTGSFVLENAGADAPEPAEGLLTDRVGRRRARGLRARGGDLRHRRGGAVAARPARDHQDGGRDRGARPLARLERRRLPRAGLHRARLAALGRVRARDARGADPRRRPGAPRARRARGDGLPDGGRRARDGGGFRVVLEELKADGGAVVNGWLMKFQADVLGVPVVVPEVSETTALGAAYLAGVATGEWSEADVRAMWRQAARYEPSMSEDERESCWRAGRGPSIAGVTKRIAPGREAQVKAQVYKDPRPAEHFDRFHERQRAKRPNWMYEAVRLLTPYLLLFYRARASTRTTSRRTAR